jgi:hypothetical protein
MNSNFGSFEVLWILGTKMQVSKGKLYLNLKLFVIMENFQNENVNEFKFLIWNNELKIMDLKRVENQFDNLTSNHLKTWETKVKWAFVEAFNTSFN